MRPPMNDSIEKVNAGADGYGDLVQSGSNVVLNCHFRDMNSIADQGRTDDFTSDAMVWLEPDAPISEGDILSKDSKYYRISKVVRAKRLGETDIQFLKCDLDRVMEIS